MDDPVPPPDFLAAVHAGGPKAAARPEHPCVFDFDLARQDVPGLPGFTGLRVYPDLIDAREAAALLDAIESEAWRGAQSGKQKQHHGPRINFNKRRMNVAGFAGLPDWAHWLEAKIRARIARDPARSSEPLCRLDDALAAYRTTDVFVLRYAPERAANLDFHTDDVFAYGEPIFDVSLESDSVLSFLHGRPGGEAVPEPDGGSTSGQPGQMTCVRVPLPARSVSVLFATARHHWEHAVLAGDIRAQRTSVTLRTLGTALRATPDGEAVCRIAATGAARQSPLPTTFAASSAAKTS